jgi:hypothetical protein
MKRCGPLASLGVKRTSGSKNFVHHPKKTFATLSAKNKPPDSANLRSVLKPDFPVAFVERIRPPNIIRLTIRKQMDGQQKVARVGGQAQGEAAS